jgi:hypothetical protein
MLRGSVVVLADDLIWATRLAAQVRAAGATPVPARDLAAYGDALPVAGAAIVDLTARAYDGVEAVAAAHRAGVAVLAVGQHDDIALRRRAMDAGAERVYSYRKLFEDGAATIERWLARLAAAAPSNAG